MTQKMSGCCTSVMNGISCCGLSLIKYPAKAIKMGALMLTAGATSVALLDAVSATQMISNPLNSLYGCESRFNIPTLATLIKNQCFSNWGRQAPHEMNDLFKQHIMFLGSIALASGAVYLISRGIENCANRALQRNSQALAQKSE